MIKCNIDKTQLILYLYSELEGQGKAELEKHLAECAECRAEVEDYRRIVDKLSRLPVVEPANAAPVRLPYPKSRVMRFATYSAIAASFLLLAAFTYIKLSTSVIPTQPPKTTARVTTTNTDSVMYAWKDDIGNEIDNLKTSTNSIINELKTASLVSLDETIQNLDNNIDSIFEETD
ncbi:MAG: zf-HC2 domain-containing protein [Planctomycetota bacterium]